MKTTLAVVAIAAGVVATLFLLVMYAAGAANMTPERLRSHYFQMKLIGAGGFACAVVASVLLARHHPTAASLVGVVPAVFVLLFVIVALIR